MREYDDYELDSLKKIIINKGICFEIKRADPIDCDWCVLCNICAAGIQFNQEELSDLYLQRYLVALNLAEEYMTTSELFELLL